MMELERREWLSRPPLRTRSVSWAIIDSNSGEVEIEKELETKNKNKKIG